MKYFLIIFTLLATMSFGSVAMACENTLDCGPGVPETTYQGGGVEIEAVRATACFTRRIGRAITLRDGTNRWTSVLVYNPETGAHEVTDTKTNSLCWTQWVQPGTWMAVRVTCRTYDGWVAVKVTKAGRYVMRPVPWTFAEKLP